MTRVSCISLRRFLGFNRATSFSPTLVQVRQNPYFVPLFCPLLPFIEIIDSSAFASPVIDFPRLKIHPFPVTQLPEKIEPTKNPYETTQLLQHF